MAKANGTGHPDEPKGIAQQRAMFLAFVKHGELTASEAAEFAGLLVLGSKYSSRLTELRAAGLLEWVPQLDENGNPIPSKKTGIVPVKRMGPFDQPEGISRLTKLGHMYGRVLLNNPKAPFPKLAA
jgi:hypothetical protein